MKKIIMVAATIAALHTGTHAQGFLKKLKDKAEKKVENAIDKKIDGKPTTSPTPSSPDNSSNYPNGNTIPAGNGNKPSNRTGAGLQNSTVPDVAQQLNDIDRAYTANNLNDARYAIQQALLGTELQLGRKLLQSLPNEVSSLAKDTVQDKVMSTHWGWDNMNMQRVYLRDDKQLTVIIGSNTAYAGMLDMYFNNGFFQNANNNGNQQMKPTRIKNNKAIIKYDEHEGYTIIMKLGQTSLITWQGINFSNEEEITNAANSFDIEGIKKLLGEQ